MSMNFEYGPADQEALERRNAQAAAAVQAAGVEHRLTPAALQHLEEKLRQAEPNEAVQVSQAEMAAIIAGRLPVLAEREATHGNFATTALIAQRFKDVSKNTPNWSGNLTDVQRETLEAIFTKIARILSGDPNHADRVGRHRRLCPTGPRAASVKIALALALVFVAVQPAQACHRFRVWSYPFPQRCGVNGHLSERLNTQIMAQAPRPAVQASKVEAAGVTERVTIEITVTPELLETWAREDALDKIKGELK